MAYGCAAAAATGETGESLFHETHKPRVSSFPWPVKVSLEFSWKFKSGHGMVFTGERNTSGTGRPANMSRP